MMQLFEIKNYLDLTWADIPLVEDPVFAENHLLKMLTYPHDQWNRVINIREFEIKEIGTYDPLFNHDYAANRINYLLHSGQYFSVCRSGKPVSPAFVWKEDQNHPHKGMWMDSGFAYLTAGNTIKNLLARITHHWYTRKTQAFMDNLLQSPFALAQAKVEEYITIPKAKSTAATAAPALAVAAEKITAPAAEKIAIVEAEKAEPAYTVLKGKYGTLHDYGDHIVHWDIDSFEDSDGVLSKLNNKHECYAVGDGFGLPSTDTIEPGERLIDLTNDEIEDGTLFGTFIDNGSGKKVYPSSRNGITTISGHVFVIDKKSGGLSADKSKVEVFHQYKSGVIPGVLHRDTIINNTANKYRLANHLDKYYVINVKK